GRVAGLAQGPPRRHLGADTDAVLIAAAGKEAGGGQVRGDLTPQERDIERAYGGGAVGTRIDVADAAARGPRPAAATPCDEAPPSGRLPARVKPPRGRPRAERRLRRRNVVPRARPRASRRRNDPQLTRWSGPAGPLGTPPAARPRL